MHLRKPTSRSSSATIPLAAALLFLASPLLHAHGEYHSVVRKLTTQIKAEPQNTEHRYRLAAAHVEHDEWKLALAECDRIEKIAPGKHQLGYFRGRSLATAGRWQEALAPLDAFLASAPSHEDALIWRARVHLQLNDPAKSAADYRQALKTSRNPESHVEFAKALVKQNLADEAVAVLQNGLKLNADDPALLECMVHTATAAKDTDAALAATERLIKTWPRPEPWMLRRAKVLAAANRSDDALAAWNALALHVKSLPNLDRAQPFLKEIEAETNAALGIKAPTPVIAPPAPAVSR
jgi:tetratricopeptide (TPR) repeat protein